MVRLPRWLFGKLVPNAPPPCPPCSGVSDNGTSCPRQARYESAGVEDGALVSRRVCIMHLPESARRHFEKIANG